MDETEEQQSYQEEFAPEISPSSSPLSLFEYDVFSRNCRICSCIIIANYLRIF